MIIDTNFGEIIAINHVYKRYVLKTPWKTSRVGVEEINMPIVIVEAFKLLLTIQKFRMWGNQEP